MLKEVVKPGLDAISRGRDRQKNNGEMNWGTMKQIEWARNEGIMVWVRR